MATPRPRIPVALRPGRTLAGLALAALVGGAGLAVTAPIAGADTPAMPGVDRNQDGRDDRAVVRVTPFSSCGLTWYWDTPTPTTDMLGAFDCAARYRTTLVPGRYPVPSRERSYHEAATWNATSPAWLAKASGSVPWGEPGDDPKVVADYDGDGATDVAVYRPGHPSVWHIHGSKGRDFAVPFGERDDVPAPGDYDGDGRADAAVARIAADRTLYFHVGRTSKGPMVTHFGNATDYIVPGDYDGDGQSDITVTRDVGGVLTWYVLRSDGRGMLTYRFGNSATDLEVPGDYDGDGRTDVAVWRPGSPGVFYILMSSTGRMERFAFGEGGDTPVATASVHAIPDFLAYVDEYHPDGSPTDITKPSGRAWRPNGTGP